MNIIGKIPRVSTMAKNIFEEQYLLPSMPVIFTEISKNWTCLKLWNTDYLKQKIGNSSVRYGKSTSHRHPDLESDIEYSVLNSSFSDYLDLITPKDKEDRNHYCLSGQKLPFYDNGNNKDICSEMHKLVKDFELPVVVDPATLQHVGLWLSARGVLSWLHYDGNQNHNHNLNAQIVGSKKVYLFPPQEAKNLHVNYEDFTFSPVNIENPSEKKHPNFKFSNCYEAHLNAGEALYIPAFWFHSFKHMDDININVNFFWMKECAVLNNPLYLRYEFLKYFYKAIYPSGFKEYPSKQKLQEHLNKMGAHLPEVLAEYEQVLLSWPGDYKK